MAITKSVHTQGKTASRDASVPEHTPQVELAVNQLGREIDEIHARLTTLEAQLEPVMLQTYPTPGGEKAEDGEGLVGLAQNITSLRMAASTAAGRLQSILDRLELGHF